MEDDCIYGHFPRLVPPSNLQLYYTKLLHVLPSIIWYKWVNAFSCSALLVQLHTKNNYTLPSSSTPNMESLHYHYCRILFHNFASSCITEITNNSHTIMYGDQCPIFEDKNSRQYTASVVHL